MYANYDSLKEAITEIYNEVKNNKEGKVADYIPELSKVNPNLFGISFCTVNGEQFSIGDVNINFSMQSCSKPLLYCIAQHLLGEQKLHSYVGYEPSGMKFNAFILNDEGKPHNPLINTGAITVSSLIYPDKEPAERFSYVIKFIKKMSGNYQDLGFDNCVYLSEKLHAHRNFALSHFMAENNVFPENSDINKILEFYFQACSILTNTETLAIITSTLANNGKCPITDEQVIDTNISKNCLSLMYMCGMYDFSGRFAFEIGLPAKSGVSGCLMLVVPNIMGLCIWSPPLDKCGNSVRGIEVCRKLVSKFSFHIFDKLIGYQSEIDNKDFDSLDEEDDSVENNMSYHFIMAASKGNLKKVQFYVEEKQININVTDYDDRSAMHVAAADGHYDIVEYLKNSGAIIDGKDRWGNTPYHEAFKNCVEKDENTNIDYCKICQLLKDIE